MLIKNNPMKKIYITCLAVLTLLGVTNAQVSVNMTDENKNPNFFEAHIPFLSLDFARSNSTFFGDFGAKLKLNRLYMDVNYRISYLNGLEQYYYTVEEPLANSVYAYKAPKEFRALFGFMVVCKDVGTTVDFHLKHVGNTNYITKVPAQKTFFVMADLGLRKGFNWVACTDKELEFETIMAPEGFTPPAPSTVRTMMDYTTLQVGVSAGSMGFYKASISGYGERRSEKSVRYYLDALVLLNSKVDDIYYENTLGMNQDNVLYTQYGLDKSKRSKVGFCLGATMNNISKFGINGGVEAAYIPGIKGSFMSNFALTITTGLSLAKILN